MSLSVQLQYYVASHGTGFQVKEHSTQDACHEAFKNLAQRLHEWAVKEDVLNRLLQCTAPCTLWKKMPIADLEVFPDDQPGEGSFIIIEAPHPGSTGPQKVTSLACHIELVDQIISIGFPN